MQLIPHVPRGWMKVSHAAKTARVPVSQANALIVSGAIPVAIDGAGFMWINRDSLRIGATDARYLSTIQN